MDMEAALKEVDALAWENRELEKIKTKITVQEENIEEIKELCKEAVALFPGLNMVGIDVLLEKGSLRPRIIEMNAQGDLIYQDIYGENMIYGEQIEVLNEWAWLNGCD